MKAYLPSCWIHKVKPPISGFSAAPAVTAAGVLTPPEKEVPIQTWALQCLFMAVFTQESEFLWSTKNQLTFPFLCIPLTQNCPAPSPHTLCPKITNKPLHLDRLFPPHVSAPQRQPLLVPWGLGTLQKHPFLSQVLHLYDKQEYQTVWYFTVSFTQLNFLRCLQYFTLWPHREMQCSAGHCCGDSSAVTQSDVSWARNSRRVLYCCTKTKVHRWV